MIQFVYTRHIDGVERMKNIVDAMNEMDRDIYIVFSYATASCCSQRTPLFISNVLIC